MTNLEALRFYNNCWGSLHGPFLTKKRLSIETKSFTMSMDLPEFQACVTAYRNWFQEILNSMDVP